jgi:hypothetical protein
LRNKNKETGMRRLYHLGLSLAVLSLLPSGEALADTYYVDSSQGNDAHPGNSPQNAWRTLTSVNQHLFHPGDKLLFRSGTRYAGQIKLQGSGRDGAPISIDTYAGTDRARIDGEGKVKEVLLLRNVEQWEVNNLEITNTGEERRGGRIGVRVEIGDFGTAHHIHLKNLYIHDVNGSNKKGSGTRGILFRNGGGREKSRFDDLLIEGCRLVHCDRDGIIGEGYWERKQWHPNLNVVIRNNVLEDIGGDCIVWWGCDGAVIEHNVVRGGRRRCTDAAAGIWPWCSDNSVVQFNEVSGMKGTLDGQAFDTDDNSLGTIFQYNYSHDNEGGFMLICCVGEGGRMVENTVIRYNISQNDGGGGKPPYEREPRIFHFAGPARNTVIYNNVFYIGPQMKTLFIYNNKYKGWTKDVYFYNNILYAEGELSYKWGEKTKFVFDHNVFFGKNQNPPEDHATIKDDPKLLGPGTGKDGFESLGGYQLGSGSPCIKAGRPMKDNGGRDFFGNNLLPLSTPCIGIHEMQAATGKTY